MYSTLYTGSLSMLISYFSGAQDSTSQIVPLEALNESVQQSISSAIANQKAKYATLNGDDGNKTDTENDEVKGQINERFVQPKRREGKGFKCEDCNKVFSSKG